MNIFLEFPVYLFIIDTVHDIIDFDCIRIK